VKGLLRDSLITSQINSTSNMGADSMSHK